jgi:uncharacterized protein YkwD
MTKITRILVAVLTIFFAVGFSYQSVAASRLAASSPYDLIAEVNALRVSNGLPAYTVNSILMQVAQGQADYMASIGSVTHYGPDGSRPYQRGLAAGYPLAGDLSLGGFYSENIIAGSGMTAAEAVLAWQGDDPHINTMLSSNLMEIGAGVADVNGYIYMVIDCARPTSGPIAYTPPAPGTTFPPITPGVIPNTPNGDGSIFHIVQSGETLGAIAYAYDVPLKELMALNRLNDKSFIYPGDKLIIRLASTATPITPSPTITEEPTITPAPTLTSIPSATSIPITPTPVRIAGSTVGDSLPVVIVILLIGLIVPAVAVIVTRRKK